MWRFVEVIQVIFWLLVSLNFLTFNNPFYPLRHTLSNTGVWLVITRTCPLSKMLISGISLWLPLPHFQLTAFRTPIPTILWPRQVHQAIISTSFHCLSCPLTLPSTSPMWVHDPAQLLCLSTLLLPAPGQPQDLITSTHLFMSASKHQISEYDWMKTHSHWLVLILWTQDSSGFVSGSSFS